MPDCGFAYGQCERPQGPRGLSASVHAFCDRERTRAVAGHGEASPAKASHPANALAAIDQVACKSMSMAHGEHRRPHCHDDASTSALSSPEHVISYSISGPDSPIPISGLNQPHPHLDRGEQVQAHEYIRTVNSGVQQRFATPRAQNPQRSLLSQR